MLLPVPYFLLTFTLPEGLRDLARCRQKLIYRLLFRASAAATQELAHDQRFIGGQIGMFGVLQTWTRNLAYHPRVDMALKGLMTIAYRYPHLLGNGGVDFILNELVPGDIREATRPRSRSSK